MDPVRRIEETVEPALADMGFELVRVRLTGATRPVLQIMAERSDGSGITVDDCAEISHRVSALLDVEDPVHGAYTLEVSSPGVDRPLTRAKDFERFAGREVKIELHHARNGRRRFRGRLEGLRDGQVRIVTGDGEVAVPLPEIRHAKLILTDELLAAVEEHDAAANGQKIETTR